MYKDNIYYLLGVCILAIIGIILYFVFKKKKKKEDVQTTSVLSKLTGEDLAKFQTNIYYSDKADELNYVYNIHGKRINNQKDKFFWS